LEIHPEVPKEGISLERLFDPGSLKVLWTQVEQLARRADLCLRKPDFLPNSHWALEAAEFAREKGKEGIFHELVFRAYFLEGQDIGSLEVLLKIGRESGLDPMELKEAIRSGRYYSVIENYRQEAREVGVTAVPTFIIGQHHITGAQSYLLLKRAIDSTLAED